MRPRADRGLRGIKAVLSKIEGLVISDDHKGLRNAAAPLYDAGNDRRVER